MIWFLLCLLSGGAFYCLALFFRFHFEIYAFWKKHKKTIEDLQELESEFTSYLKREKDVRFLQVANSDQVIH